MFSGLLSRDRSRDCGQEEDLYSIISSATDMLTSLDLTDSVTDLTSSDSSVKTLTDTETSREPEQCDANTDEATSVRQREWTQSERKENLSRENSQISAILNTKIVTEV